MHQRVDLKRLAQGVAQQTLGRWPSDEIALSANAAVFQAAQIESGDWKDIILALNCPVRQKHNVKMLMVNRCLFLAKTS